LSAGRGSERDGRAAAQDAVVVHRQRQRARRGECESHVGHGHEAFGADDGSPSVTTQTPLSRSRLKLALSHHISNTARVPSHATDDAQMRIGLIPTAVASRPKRLCSTYPTGVVCVVCSCVCVRFDRNSQTVTCVGMVWWCWWWVHRRISHRRCVSDSFAMNDLDFLSDGSLGCAPQIHTHNSSRHSRTLPLANLWLRNVAWGGSTARSWTPC